MALWWLLLASRAQIRVLSIAMLQTMQPRAIPPRRASSSLSFPHNSSSSSSSILLLSLRLHLLLITSSCALFASEQSAVGCDSARIGDTGGRATNSVERWRQIEYVGTRHALSFAKDQLRTDGQNALAQNTDVHEHVGVCEPDTFERLQ